MAIMSFKDWYRMHFTDRLVYSLYFAAPKAMVGEIFAHRETVTGLLFEQARIGNGVVDIGTAEYYAEVEARLRETHGIVFKSQMSALPKSRVTKIDPMAFFHECHALWSGAEMEMDVCWMLASPREYIADLILRKLGKTSKDIFHAVDPDRVDIDMNDLDYGLALAPPKIVRPSVGEVPMVLFYSLVPI